MRTPRCRRCAAGVQLINGICATCWFHASETERRLDHRLQRLRRRRYIEFAGFCVIVAILFLWALFGHP